MKTKASVKQILIDFIYIREQLAQLFKGRKDYEPIINFLCSKEYLDEELDIPFPKIKDVEEASGMKNHTLRKLLLKMHSEIFSYDRRLNLNFNKTIYHFYIRLHEYRCDFTMNYLTHLPRIGENISLPFIKSTMPLTSFYVENIRHEFEGSTQIVIISLKVGNYNEYWRYMRDRATELRKIGINELYDLNEMELKNLIYKENPHL